MLKIVDDRRWLGFISMMALAACYFGGMFAVVGGLVALIAGSRLVLLTERIRNVKAMRKVKNMRSIDDYISQGIEHFALLAGRAVLISGVLSGLGLIAVQVIKYLKIGQWESYSILSAIAWLRGDSENWIRAPSDWVGFHRVCEYIPLSFTLIVAGFGIGFVLISWANDFSDSNDRIYSR